MSVLGPQIFHFFKSEKSGEERGTEHAMLRPMGRGLKAPTCPIRELLGRACPGNEREMRADWRLRVLICELTSKNSKVGEKCRIFLNYTNLNGYLRPSCH